MEVSEYHLIVPYQRILLFDRFLNFNDHVTLGIHFPDSRKYFSAYSFIISINKATSLSGSGLNVNRVVVFYQLENPGGRYTDPVFVVLDLFWYPYFHNVCVLHLKLTIRRNNR